MDSKQEYSGSRPSRSRQPEGAAGQESKPEQQEAEGEASRGAASGDVSGGWRPRPVAPSGTSKQNKTNSVF